MSFVKKGKLKMRLSHRVKIDSQAMWAWAAFVFALMVIVLYVDSIDTIMNMYLCIIYFVGRIVTPFIANKIKYFKVDK